MRTAVALPLLLFAAAPAGADVVSPEAFEALSEGRTLHFTRQGEPFGAEQYFPGRRALWRFADGTCDRGFWRAEGQEICFVYEGNPGPQCWTFERRGAGYAAALVEEGAPPGLVLELSHADDAPLDCPAPDVGS
jgi:hypothetical protein